ncbi:hypothetical protein C2S51_021998 [Perilla frutescens var. frutescens]|nr:hypothetical protein C2S51_021998 [Perilla frutescens var. frutescens]
MLPRFIAIKSYYNSDKGYIYYKADEGKGSGSVVLGEDKSVFSTLVKIEVEPAKGYSHGKFVHLRFCHSNRYWARKANHKLIVAESKQPEEDTSKSSCTLFEQHWNADSDKAGVFHFTHVQSGGRLRIDDLKSVYCDDKYVPGDGYLAYVDWDTLVNMPQHVAFKGNNNSFLKGYWQDGLNYLQFGSPDPNGEQSGHEVQLMPDGHVKIKSVYFGRFWRYGTNWIWADSNDDSSSNVDTLFWPVKIDNNTIALRSAANNNFCQRLTTDNKTSCLNAATKTINDEAKLEVHELVVERKIYNVRYRMEDARIFGEKPFVAGTTTAVNRSDTESSIAVAVEYKDSRSYSFSRSLSLTAGVKTSIEADVMGIAKETIEFSFEITGALEWAKSEVTERTVTATGTVPVPPRTKAVVNYVGTLGTCNIPYSYTQQDKSSTDGRVLERQLIDGIYTGVNCYNFSFEVLQYQSL